MPVVAPLAVNPAVLNSKSKPWRSMLRIDTVGADVNVVQKAWADFHPEKLVYAEGDSWFDKFTPIPVTGTNLLETIRTPFFTAVVDVAHIGDEAKDMVRGWQERQTKAMFDIIDFDAILLSAGGNDLKNIFADLLQSKGPSVGGGAKAWTKQDLQNLASATTYAGYFDRIVEDIKRFVALRDGSKRCKNIPLLIHGYDYFQPRPASAEIFKGTRKGLGPWLYPAMTSAGLTDAQMRSAADAVVDELNSQLSAKIATLPNVHYIDSRGLLLPAAPGTTSSRNDWLDEIHPNESGFTSLARNRWDVALAKALGWVPVPGDTVPAANPQTITTAYAGAQTATA